MWKTLTFVGEVHVETGAVVYLFDDDFALEEGQIELLVEEPVRDADQTWLVHQQDRAALVVELPSTPEGYTLVVSGSTVEKHYGEPRRRHIDDMIGDSRAGIGFYIQSLHLLRVDLVQIGLGSFERGVLLRDMFDVRVRIDVPFDFQLARFLVDNAEIADLQ